LVSYLNVDIFNIIFCKLEVINSLCSKEILVMNDFIFYFRGVYGNVIIRAGAIVSKSIGKSGIYVGVSDRMLDNQ
jgi:hypothetical protein